MAEANVIASSEIYNNTIDPVLIKQNIGAEFVIKKNDQRFSASFEHVKQKDRYYLYLYYPYNKAKFSYLRLTKDITNIHDLLSDILFNILTINILMMVLIVFYALFLSRMLILPIKILNYKLSQINENFLNNMDTSSLPSEFIPLGKSINGLIERIQNFIKYQKELFIGIAHELKTPLAVMKTKNEVTLLKKHAEDKYIDTLKSNNISINEMNKMITSILEIGRQESAQFEELIEVDLIVFLKERLNNFKILAHQEKKQLIQEVPQKSYTVKIQPTLLLHILQNFVQNAIKFTKDGGSILVKTTNNKNGFTIKVIDEGIGIDEKNDYFAPFKRFGNKSGAGLGLFLAKGAADAIGATITLKNRTDNHIGVVATLFIPKL